MPIYQTFMFPMDSTDHTSGSRGSRRMESERPIGSRIFLRRYCQHHSLQKEQLPPTHRVVGRSSFRANKSREGLHQTHYHSGAPLDMSRSLIIGTLLSLLTGPVLAANLLPSQSDPGIFTVKICQDPEVLSLIKAYVDAQLRASTSVAKSMQADDTHLEAVFPAKNLVGCSIVISTSTVEEAVAYVIGPERESYRIMIGGDTSKLFPTLGTIRPR